MDIQGAKALVTGAGAGIGAATASMLAEQGAEVVVLADIDAAGLAEVAARLEAAGTRAISRVVDLSSPASVVSLLAEADAETGGLDIVHNNAGIMTGAPDFPDTALEKMVAVIQVNLIAMMVGTRQAVELMRSRNTGGVIINTASIAAFSPMPTDPAYAASKAGIVSFTESCQPLHDAFGIRVMAVCPAIVDTAIVPRQAEWLQPALKAVKMLRPEDIAARVKEVIEDDSLAGGYVRIENEPAA